MNNLTGQEEITGSGLSIIDYWRWAHSDIIDNTERGIFAEFLVHAAVNETEQIRTSWKPYDILTPEGIKIEVKASGYLQSWHNKKLSAISFSIRPTHTWNAETNRYSGECVRQSDVYVFCLHKHKEPSGINILDLSQWTFFVLPTSILYDKAGNQKTITLNRIKELGAKEVNYSHLREAIRSEKFCKNTH